MGCEEQTITTNFHAFYRFTHTAAVTTTSASAASITVTTAFIATVGVVILSTTVAVTGADDFLIAINAEALKCDRVNNKASVALTFNALVRSTISTLSASFLTPNTLAFELGLPIRAVSYTSFLSDARVEGEFLEAVINTSTHCQVALRECRVEARWALRYTFEARIAVGETKLTLCTRSQTLQLSSVNMLGALRLTDTELIILEDVFACIFIV
jgi:hypothetical protein